MPTPKPRNLRISWTVAVVLSIGGAMLSLTGIAVTIMIVGVDATSAPFIMSILGTISTVAVGLVSALKSTEAADTAAKAHQTAVVAVSKTSSLEQQLHAKCGEICPAIVCPLRQQGGIG